MVKFVTDAFSEEEANVIVVGVDCSKSLREESQLSEVFDVDDKINLLENVRIHDAENNIKMDRVEGKVKEIVGKKKIPLTLAKLHTATFHAMKAIPDNAKLVVFDAHPDLKDEYEGSKYSHACWLRRWIELNSRNRKRVIILGVRATDEDEYNFMKDNGITYFTANNIIDSLENVKQRLRNFVGESAVYVSIDMDFFDPSIAPAVKYPEPGGLLYRDFLALLDAIKGIKIVGIDCVEIRPIPSNRITEALAVMAIFKILSLSGR